jgi:hypothetical protein
MRTFVLARLSRPSLTGRRFGLSKKFDLNEFLKGSLGLFKGRQDFEVVVELRVTTKLRTPRAGLQGYTAYRFHLNRMCPKCGGICIVAVNFAANLPELFAGKEMGEDALRVLNEIIPLQAAIRPDVAAELPHLRETANWATRLY